MAPRLAGLSHPLSAPSARQAMITLDWAARTKTFFHAAISVALVVLHFGNETPIACSNATSPAKNWLAFCR